MSFSNAKLEISAVRQVAITVQDLERATAFYRDVLGLTLLFTTGALSFFDCGGLRLMLSPPETPHESPCNSILYFSVPNISVAHERLLNSGVKCEGSPHLIAKMHDHDLWMSHFRDSENNILALMSEVTRPS